MLATGEVGGLVSIYGQNGKMKAALGADEHGGNVIVVGRADGTASMFIDEHGSGDVSTWNRDGIQHSFGF